MARSTLVLFHSRECQGRGFAWSRGVFDQSISFFPLICEVGLYFDKGCWLIEPLHSLDELVRERSGAPQFFVHKK